ncbi:putative reverse transcriptase zinc-binding domain-containing protein [Helianthus annuus]|nr:putative reverse transcriptase zinc-binding domain-containing protein [Helianthus annuus]
MSFPLLFELEKKKTCSVSERVSWESNKVTLSWFWSRSLLSVNEEAELLDLTLLLSEFVVSDGPDRWVWSLGNSESFAVADIKKVAAEHCRSIPAYVFVWNNYVPKKVGVVSWRAISDRLPTKVALASRNIIINDTRCVLCGDYEESSEHLFVSCHFTQSVWLVMAQWCRIPPIVAFCLRDLLDAHLFLHGCKKKKKVLNAIVQVVIWCVWKVRNEVIFGQVAPSISSVVEESKSMAFLWIKNRSGSSQWSWNEWRSFSIGL